jgi:hypothetical protein
MNPALFVMNPTISNNAAAVSSSRIGFQAAKGQQFFFLPRCTAFRFASFVALQMALCLVQRSVSS